MFRQRKCIDMIDFGQARQQMVERQIAGRGLHDPVVLAAMKHVPREAFVPENLRDAAFGRLFDRFCCISN